MVEATHTLPHRPSHVLIILARQAARNAVEARAPRTRHQSATHEGQRNQCNGGPVPEGQRKGVARHDEVGGSNEFVPRSGMALESCEPPEKASNSDGAPINSLQLTPPINLLSVNVRDAAACLKPLLDKS